MTSPRRLRARRGFSIVELLVAVTLTLAVFAITLPFVRVQSRALGANAGRMDAEQLARYAQRIIDEELSQATQVGDQPMLVYAGPMGIAFNANLLAPDTTDASAKEIESGATTTLTEGWRVADAAVIPLTARTYPTVNYANPAGGLSRVETISYFLRADTVTGRSDVYVLYRRVNARDSTQVVSGLHVPTDSSFFSYFKTVADTLQRIPTGSLPLYWDSTSITGIRTIGLRSAGFFRNRMEGVDVIRTVQWRVNLQPMRVASTACAATPAAATGLSATGQFSTTTSTDSTNKWSVRLAWTASTGDVAAGAVRRYAIDRQVSGVWSTIGAVPAIAAATYRYDAAVPRGNGALSYRVRAISCNGVASAGVTAAITVTP